MVKGLLRNKIPNFWTGSLDLLKLATCADGRVIFQIQLSSLDLPILEAIQKKLAFGIVRQVSIRGQVCVPSKRPL